MSCSSIAIDALGSGVRPRGDRVEAAEPCGLTPLGLARLGESLPRTCPPAGEGWRGGGSPDDIVDACDGAREEVGGRLEASDVARAEGRVDEAMDVARAEGRVVRLLLGMDEMVEEEGRRWVGVGEAGRGAGWGEVGRGWVRGAGWGEVGRGAEWEGWKA
eukprot:Sspe_Gene.14453::Locus_5003_Transcript_1_1_Confidence_1.000_Length_1240::g.14453::m.14453